MHIAVAIDIANVHVGLWSSLHSSVVCSVACRIVNLLLLATALQVWVGLVSSAWAGLVSSAWAG